MLLKLPFSSSFYFSNHLRLNTKGRHWILKYWENFMITLINIRSPIVCVKSISKPLVYPQWYFSDRDNDAHHRFSQSSNIIRMLKTYLPRGGGRRELSPQIIYVHCLFVDGFKFNVKLMKWYFRLDVRDKL